MSIPDAIVLENITKHFKKTTVRREYTTVKTELIRIIKGERRAIEPATHIEALKGVSFRVPKGKTVGIIGRNGSGKSTLLKLVTGIYTPTSGKLHVEGRISALLELGAGFHPDFTGRENILINGIILGMSRTEVKERIEEIIAFAELGDFIDEPVRTYSSGMFMRLAFAVATHVDPDVLIIDEILSVGDEHFSKKSSAKMEEFRRAGKTIVLVTHSLGTVESWCDYAVWIDGGKTRLFGDPRTVVGEYRKAVHAAEEEAQRTGTSALSTPGAALPSSSTEGEVVVKFAKLEVSYAKQLINVAVELEAVQQAGATLTFDVSAADGRQLFVVTKTLEPWSGLKPVQAELGPLSLGIGSWRVTASVQPTVGIGGPAEVRAFDVTEALSGLAGLVQPATTWR